MRAALKIDMGSIGYKGKPILENINLVAQQKQLIMLMGLNGSGKSTLLKSLSAFNPLIAGRIEIMGDDLSQFTRKDLSKLLSVVLTDHNTTGLMTVRELVQLGRYPHTNWSATLSSEDQKIIDQALEDTQITPFADRFLHELSDGQRQKAFIARAIAQDTPILLLDEPTTHLDIGNKVEIMKLLHRLAHELDKVVIMSTHDIQLAGKLADSLWIISEGQIVADVPEELYLNGGLSALFNTKDYDVLTGNISSTEIKGQSYVIESESTPAREWTRHALQRLGYQVVDSGKDPSNKDMAVIRIKNAGNYYQWRLDSLKEAFSTLSGLLEFLKTNK